MTELFYDHEKKPNALRSPDLLRSEPAFVGNVLNLPDQFAGAHSLKVAVTFAANDGPRFIDNAEVVAHVGQVTVIAMILNGRRFLKNWVLVHGTREDFNAAGAIISSIETTADLGRPALLQSPLIVSQQSASGNSAYTWYQREALAIAGAQLYICERLLVGATGNQERAGNASGAYEHLSPKLTPLRTLLRGHAVDESAKLTDDDRLENGDVGPDDKVYRFLTRVGSPLIAELYGPLYGGTTRTVARAWLLAGRKIGETQDPYKGSHLLSQMLHCLPLAIDIAANALSRHGRKGDIHFKADEAPQANDRFSATLNDNISEALLRPTGKEIDVEGLTMLAFFWRADPVRHIPELHLWSSHFAAARFLGDRFRHRGSEALVLQPDAHWGLQALSDTFFEGILSAALDDPATLLPSTARAREWLRNFNRDLREIIDTEPGPISAPAGIFPSWSRRAIRKRRP